MAATYTDIATAPDWKLHRDKITVVDSVAPGGNLLNKNNGINGRGYVNGMASLSVGAGVGDVTFEVMFWSDVAAQFVSEDTPLNCVVAATGTIAMRFPINGRRFIVAVTVNAAGLEASAEVAASGLDERYD